ncbi:glucan endo-1,3-beta-glucosidase 5-like [Punica granatum]|uniref:glucan endo-1,3-beta-D-glucosidase n=1 Tax=Punica granatum TaxID=22663 RepID=A0A6P8DW13_PUNGR|nr:glucan endo-1,3-beta-glucosidase 5-like [Punica granatum]
MDPTHSFNVKNMLDTHLKAFQHLVGAFVALQTPMEHWPPLAQDLDNQYVAVGNEPFLTSYEGQYVNYVVPTLLNLQQSLAKANLAGSVKLVVPCNADAYEANLPSQGAFRPELTDIMTQLVSFLNTNGSPFVVNIYPFLSLYGSSDFPQDYASFEGTTHPVTDGNNVYTNAFDGNFDTLVAALTKIGYSQMPIVIGEVGWPTDGAFNANLSAARAFNQGLINHVLSNRGTPLRPGVPPMDVYLFSLLDEGAKSVLPGNFERHWGIFSFDGQAKYALNLGWGSKLLKNARNVQYLPSRWCVADPTKDLSNVANHFRLACSEADCTTLNYGGWCNGIGAKGNISYAFNSIYQLRMQNSQSCDFDGIRLVTFLNPSVGECRFLVGVTDMSFAKFRACSNRLIYLVLILWGLRFLGVY